MQKLLTEKTFDTGEITLNYAEGPGGEGPAADGPAADGPGADSPDAERPDAPRSIVMLHGLTADWLGFRDLMSRLSGRWHSYACDLRGHGKSGRDDGRYSLVDYKRDILSFLEKISGPAVLLGHSLGALTALLCAAEKLNMVRGLILLDPPVYVRNAPVGIHSGVADWFGWVHETMKDHPTLDQVVEACRLREPDAGEDGLRAMALRVSRVDAGTVGAALEDRMGAGVDMDAALKKLRCPTLVLRGEWKYGACVRDEDAEWFHVLAPSTQVIQIRGGTHGFLWERAEETISHIQEFLQKSV
ncbi:MAG: alpha/beta fold hydrolase [Spirochaetia bacterium]